jgi:hypothetical protein
MKGTLSTINKIKNLARQIAAKSSKKYANPQPAATKDLAKVRRHE